MNSKCFMLIGLHLLLYACVEPYEIANYGANERSIVISGSITTRQGYQMVEVSRVVDVKIPLFEGMSGCEVLFLEEQGKMFKLQEVQRGKYGVQMSDDDLQEGKSYQLRVYTPDGKEYASSYEKIGVNPPINEVYGERKDKSGVDNLQKGVQFYYDFVGDGEKERFYKIELYETWEYHAAFPINWTYDGKIAQSNIVYDYYTCYKTQKIDQVFTLSTGQLEGTYYPRFPLNWEYEEPEKFKYKYSLLVVQYELSEEAYGYWKKLEELNNVSDGMFTKQPGNLESNIKNIEDETEEVIGFFYVSSLQQKRFIYNDDFDIMPNENLDCILYEEDKLNELSNDRYPYYLVMDAGKVMMAPKTCFDCQLKGGSIIKPDFW